MICRDVVSATTNYLEGALSEQQRREWEVHVASCADCARYFAQMCVTIRLMAESRRPLRHQEAVVNNSKNS